MLNSIYKLILRKMPTYLLAESLVAKVAGLEGEAVRTGAGQAFPLKPSATPINLKREMQIYVVDPATDKHVTLAISDVSKPGFGEFTDATFKYER